MKAQGLYDPRNEHDACGVGFVVTINGRKTNQIVQDGITILKNLIHRGAVGGDQKTGDGAGILTQIPHAFFSDTCASLKISLPEEFEYGVGMLFLPRDKTARKKLLAVCRDEIQKEGGTLLGCRDVPTDPRTLGKLALASMLHVGQIFLRLEGLSGDALERKLYTIRRVLENRAQADGFSPEEFYVPSLSCRTIVYKGMFVAPELEAFYPDLTDPRFESSFALVHQRYSTNTFPSWPLAQPFRTLAHNGEINTLRGNVNKMNAREATLSSPVFGDDIKKLLPIITPGLSDSGQLDQVLELLIRSDRSIEHSMMMMIPEAFGKHYHISQDKRAFFEYHAAVMEPWDGPAAVAFTDGTRIGAILDRNGLRPARYTVCLLYTSPSPRDRTRSRMPSSA